MFSASLTFFLITWRRHLLSKNSQSSVRGDEVGKCTVRSACFLVPEAGGMHLTKGAIHSTKLSGNFGPKLNGSVRSNWKSFEKRVHLLRWSSFPGRTGWNFGWMDRAPKLPEISVQNSIGRDPFNQKSDRSDREKWSTSKGGPVSSKLFRLDRTDPLSFGPKFPEILAFYHVWSAIDCLWYQPGAISFRNRLPTVPS